VDELIQLEDMHERWDNMLYRGYKVKAESDSVGRRQTAVLDARQEAVTAPYVDRNSSA
jgi:hypothetical protein